MSSNADGIDKIELKKELSVLRQEVLTSLRNGMVLPNTLLQTAKERKLTEEESGDASRCLHTSIAAVEQKFLTFLNRYPS